jgi:hypothetical protein
LLKKRRDPIGETARRVVQKAFRTSRNSPQSNNSYQNLFQCKGNCCASAKAARWRTQNQNWPGCKFCTAGDGIINPELQPMHLALSADVLKRLRQEASRRGVEPEDLARQAIEEKLGSSEGVPPNRTALELMDQWDREDETDDPTELERRQREFEEFKEAINLSHSSTRKIYP